jgi:hypothetical protein
MTLSPKNKNFIKWVKFLASCFREKKGGFANFLKNQCRLLTKFSSQKSRLPEAITSATCLQFAGKKYQSTASFLFSLPAHFPK